MLALSGLALTSTNSKVVAATATANLPVAVTVAANCTITTTAVSFVAVYDPVVTHATNPDDGTGTVTVTCTKGAGSTIALDVGANASASQPRMKGPGASDYLNYTLYSDTTRTTAWSGASYTIGAAPSKAARPFTVYARIPAGQDISTGSYSDTVVATVNF
jgi:spore coat protein U-like protein